jgi:hypothetical protein
LGLQLTGRAFWQCKIFHFLVGVVSIPLHIVMILAVAAVIAFLNVWSMVKIMERG